MKLSTDSSSSAPVFHAENIPAELRNLPQFVCWHYFERNGKRTKPPVDAKSNGQILPAKSNDPATWSSFDVAVATAQRLNLAGIGLALAENDGLTGLDLDHVFDPETGELDPLANEVLSRFAGTYTEVSPSGNGLRIWCYGKPARSGKCVGKIKWLEVYSHPSNRYLTVTGNHWPNSAGAVTDQQDALNWLHERFMQESTGTREPSQPLASPPVESMPLDDVALVDKARQAANGAVFGALWSGDTQSQGGDHSAADLALLNLLAFWTNRDAARMDRLFRQSGLMRAKWDVVNHADGSTYGQASISKAIAGCREGYSGKKKARKSKGEPMGKAGAALPGKAAETELNPYRGTDDANADLLLKQHGADIRYCPPWDEWLIWTGTHWRRDDRLDIERLAADVPQLLRERAARLTGQIRELLDRLAGMMHLNPLPAEYSRLRKQQTALSDEVDGLLKLAGRLESTAKRGCLLMAARHKVVVHHSDLDKGHYLLNAHNGTVDLKTGQLRPHERRDLLTHDTEIAYSAAATAPTWLAFLHSTFAGDTDLINFVQRAVGYSLTGDVKEQVLLICHGVGSNGKSVFLNILRKLLGMLAIQAAPDLLMQDKQRRHPTEQADLFSKRLVVCQETGEGRRFNETPVKQLTGGDGIRARRMQEDFWEFNPTHKLWLSTNHKPEIRGTDHAIWRRIRLIPFTVTFTDDGPARKDPDMERKLEAELPGILAWAVVGCLDWQRQGLKPPPAVVEATNNYQAEMDVLAAWMNDCCVVKKHCETKAADLYASYTAWCEQSGEFAEKQRKWGMRLTERGFLRFGSTGNVTKWRGLGLLAAVNEVNEVNEVNQKRPKSENQKNDFSIGENSGISLTSLTSLTLPSPVESALPAEPAEPRPPRPLVCTWRADDGRLITKCSDPDLQRDEAGQVVCCANCGSVQP